MAKITKARQQELEGHLQWLRKHLMPGDTVYTSLKHVTRSGMYRVIELYIIQDNTPFRITGFAADLLEGYDLRHEGAKAHGCGMDMGFHLVYNLSSRLFPDGFDCIGKDCPSNDHMNAGNAISHGRCFICGNPLPEKVEHRRSNRPQYNPDPVCSAECALKVWHHESGGYALRQKWM